MKKPQWLKRMELERPKELEGCDIVLEIRAMPKSSHVTPKNFTKTPKTYTPPHKKKRGKYASVFYKN